MNATAPHLKVLSLFSGIGAFEQALKTLDFPHTHEVVHYCDINPHASKSYSILHNVPEEKNLKDVQAIDPTTLEDFDLMTYGFPCQDLSALGSQSGAFDTEGNLTRSGLFLPAVNILKHKQPKFAIAENVRMLVSKKFEKEYKLLIQLLDEAGYNSYVKILNAKDFNLPQSRNRVFIVSIRKDVDDGTFVFPTPIPLTCEAKDFYDLEVSEELYITEHQQKTVIHPMRLQKKYSSLNAPVLICMTTKQGQKSNPQNFVQDNKGVRILSPQEMMAFMGFEKEQGTLLAEAGIPHRHIGFMCGNSIAVPVLRAIFTNLLQPKTDTPENV